MNNRRTELFPVPMRKRPWNLIDVPVYSLVTRNGDETNMNLCTYVTAIAKPKRRASSTIAIFSSRLIAFTRACAFESSRPAFAIRRGATKPPTAISGSRPMSSC